ncbi:MAG TPA: hypothetical protein VG897_07895 [Terriglobales bacterium]|nr:hypothetical protein [Terriglobales bacterium]
MKTLILFLLSAVAAFAQYSAPSLDAYGGLTAVSCTNTSNMFTIVTVGNRKVYCTPAGHVYYFRSLYTLDLNLLTTADENGHGFDYYALQRYGTAANWGSKTVDLIKTWGMNGIGPYGNLAYVGPMNGVQVPYIIYGNIGYYSMLNSQGFACPVKDLYYSMGQSGNTSTWGGFRNGNGLIDFEDPCYSAYYAGMLAGDYYFQAIAGLSTTLKKYAIGFNDLDADNAHGLIGGPDFTAQFGNNDFRRGYASFFTSPLNYANSQWQQVYVDGKVYEKNRWRTLLETEYTTISALNTAWGSSYTTFGSSGYCAGTTIIDCATSGAAESLGTGNASTKTFSATAAHTNISAFSVYIKVGSNIVGGDTGTGTIYGTGGTGCGALSGTVNYSTGAVSVTCGTAPGSGVAVTFGYVANGWGTGTGFLDEDCRSSHSSYCGDGSGNTTIYLTGLSSAVKADIGMLTQDVAHSYTTTGKTNVNAWASASGFPGPILYMASSANSSWGVPPDRYTLAGINGVVDVFTAGLGGPGYTLWTQSMLDFFNTYAGDMPIIHSSYKTANPQSSLAWVGSACTHSGTTVTCTVATPNKFSAMAGNFHIETSCDHSDFDVAQIGFTATTTTVTYTKSPAPINSSATCSVTYGDGGDWATQAAKGTAFYTDATDALNSTYTADGIHPYVGYLIWGAQDNWAEALNWGIFTYKGNPYNGVDDVSTSQPCSFDATVTCGGENSVHGTNLGDSVSGIENANTAIDTAFLGGPVIPTWPANSTPTSPGPVSLGVTGYHPSWCWANCVAGGEISYYAPRGDGSGRYDIWTMAQSLTSGFTCHTCTSTYLNTQLSDRTSGNAEWCPNGDCVVFQAQTSTSSLTPTQASPGTGLDNFLGAVNPNFTSGFQVLDQDPDATGGFLQFRFSHDGNWLFGGHEYAQGGTTTGVFGIAGYARVYSVTYPSGVITLSGTGISGFGAPITYASISGTAPTGTVTCVLTAANGTTSTGALVYGVMNAISGSFTGQTLRVIFAGNGYSTIPTQWSTSGTGCGDGTTRVTTTGGKLYGADYKLPDSSQAYFVEGGDSSIDSKWLYFSAVGSTTQAFLLYRMNIMAPAPAATIELFTPAGTQWSEVPRVSPAGLPCFVSSWFTGVTPPATIGSVALDVACQAADKQTIWPITFFNQAATMPVWRISPNTPIISEVFAFSPNGSGILLNASDGVSIAGLYWIPFRYTTGITTGNGASTGNGLNF